MPPLLGSYGRIGPCQISPYHSIISSPKFQGEEAVIPPIPGHSKSQQDRSLDQSHGNFDSLTRASDYEETITITRENSPYESEGENFRWIKAARAESLGQSFTPAKPSSGLPSSGRKGQASRDVLADADRSEKNEVFKKALGRAMEEEETLNQLLRNPIFLSAVFSWVLAQILKVLINLFRKESRRSDEIFLTFLWRSGGMPSSHSAAVTAVTTSVGFVEGTSSSIFIATFVMSAVVIRDALGVAAVGGESGPGYK